MPSLKSQYIMKGLKLGAPVVQAPAERAGKRTGVGRSDPGVELKSGGTFRSRTRVLPRCGPSKFQCCKHTPHLGRVGLASCTFLHTPHHPAHHHTSLPPTKIPKLSPKFSCNIENSPRTASKPPIPDHPDSANLPQCRATCQTSSRYGTRNRTSLQSHELERPF